MVHIAGRDPIGGVVAASRNCQIVILLNCRLKDGMHKPFTISLIVESSDLFRSIDWCIDRVYKHLIPENSVLVSWHRLITNIGKIYTRRIGERGLGYGIPLTLAVRNENQRIGCTRTVN